MLDHSYSVSQLHELWKEYHALVHDPGSATPCDACPGDACYTTAFLDWLEAKPRVTPGPSVISRIKPIGELE